MMLTRTKNLDSSLILLLTALLLSPALLQAEGILKWTDARGVVHYGDEAPRNQRVKEIDMPKLTVVEDYGKQWLPLEPEQPAQAKSRTSVNVKKVAVNPSFQPSYTRLDFIAPKSGQIIKAKDGDITAMLKVKPPLKKGHKLIITIDGKAQKKTRSRIANFSNLTAGKHTMSAQIVDNSGALKMRTNPLSFKVNR
jgi:hypothetical protein